MTEKKPRKEWRRTETPILAWFDFIGLRHFIYGGDPEWQRRRYFMVLTLGIGLFCTIAAIGSHIAGQISEALVTSVIENYFTLLMAIAPAYIVGAAFEKSSKLRHGVQEQVEQTVVVEQGNPPERTETTVTKTTTPARHDPTEPE